MTKRSRKTWFCTRHIHKTNHLKVAHCVEKLLLPRLSMLLKNNIMSMAHRVLKDRAVSRTQMAQNLR